MSERPFFRSAINELEATFESAGSDEGLLRQLLDELEERQNTRAQSLAKRVSLALQQNYAESTPPLATPPNASFEFDPEQRPIVNAPSDARIIVNAPPGTGKTAIACGRIARLLNEGVPANSIWLLSFTRTAVRELRNRIQALADSRADVYAVRIATLDSRAWNLVQGFTGTTLAEMAGGYEQTLDKALSVLRSDDDAVLDFLDEIQHLVVDEAQDLIGIRRAFVEELIGRIPAEAGVTILTDDAQAIYDFSKDAESEHGSTTLPDALRAQPGREFHEAHLKTVHRTGSDSLKALYIDGRNQMLGAIRRNDGQSQQLIRECVRRWNDGQSQGARDATPATGALKLYRSRLEVLDASCWLGDRQEPHQLRISGLPVALHPWIALSLAGVASPRLVKADFEERWYSVQVALGDLTPDREICWAMMLRAAGIAGSIDIAGLRDVLSRSRPPLEFTTQDLGLYGPVIGTIHASKGREADHVELMLCDETDDPAKANDEARLTFVGATRARRSLKVGKGLSLYPKETRSGRQYSLERQGSRAHPRARMEIDRNGDVEVPSSVATALFPTASEAEENQQTLRRNLIVPTSVTAWRRGAVQGYGYTLRIGTSEEGKSIGMLSSLVSRDVREIMKTTWPSQDLRVPNWIGPLLLLSVRSTVLALDDPDLEKVHEPWRTAGIWLTPVITGLPRIPFFKGSYGGDDGN
ncbi:hypothetical protein BH09GEM1_BH09GEM1_42420 [soil metagenome]